MYATFLTQLYRMYTTTQGPKDINIWL